MLEKPIDFYSSQIRAVPGKPLMMVGNWIAKWNFAPFTRRFNHGFAHRFMDSMQNQGVSRVAMDRDCDEQNAFWQQIKTGFIVFLQI